MSPSILTLPPPEPPLRLSYGDHPEQVADLWLPEGRAPHPVILGIHGGFWRARYDRAHFRHVCAALARDGLACLNIEYRRLGHAGGGWPGTFLDVARAADHLREIAPRYGLDGARVVALGHSAGGHLALWLAGRHRLGSGSPLYLPDPLPLAGAISIAGVVDLAAASRLRLSDGGDATDVLMGGPPDAYPTRYRDGSPIELLPLGRPQILIHGDQDAEVPFALSERYVATARAAGDAATLVPLPGSGHYEPIDPRSPEWSHVREAARALTG